MTTSVPDALAGLRDIHLPDAVSFWPLAPGWWIGAGICGAMMLAAAMFVRARRRSLRRAAVAELAAAERRFEGNADCGELATSLSALLRRVALARFPTVGVAAFHGDEWLQFLADRGRKPDFPDEVAAGLETALCMGPLFAAEPGETDRWIASVRAWIRSNT